MPRDHVPTTRAGDHTAAPSQTTSENGTEDHRVGEFNSLLTELINGIESVISTRKKLALDLKTAGVEFRNGDHKLPEHWTPEARRAFLQQIPEVNEVSNRTAQGYKELADDLQKICWLLLDQVIDEIADVLRWILLAREDHNEFRDQQKTTLRAYSALLKVVCGIQSHRPPNEAQTLLIRNIYESDPSQSWGDVSDKYNERPDNPPGEKMTAKRAERIYKRIKLDSDLILDTFTGYLPVLKQLQKTTKA